MYPTILVVFAHSNILGLLPLDFLFPHITHGTHSWSFVNIFILFLGLSSESQQSHLGFAVDSVYPPSPHLDTVGH